MPLTEKATLKHLYERSGDYGIKLAIASLGDALDRPIISMRNGIWRKLCPKAVSYFKDFNPTLNMARMTLAKEVGFVKES